MISRTENGLNVVRHNLKRIETLESEQRALYAEGENFKEESWQLLNASKNNIRVSYDFTDVFQDLLYFIYVFYCFFTFGCCILLRIYPTGSL
jgi:hypothetical protein